MSKAQKRRCYTVTEGNMNGSTWTHKCYGKSEMIELIREKVDDRTSTFVLTTYLGKMTEQQLYHGNGD